MTQRISGLKDEEADILGREIIDSCTQLLGRASNSTRILAKHSPYVSRWFLGFVASLRQPDLGATTEPRLRALATIKTSMTNACTYCTAHTSIYGKRLGISEEECAAMDGDNYKTSDLFTAKEKAVIAWAEAMTNNTARPDRAVWEELRAH